MKHIVQVRHLPRYLNVAVLLTLVTGGALYWWVSGGLATVWLASRYGLAISLGAAMTIAAALMGQVVNAPTAARLG